MSRAGGPNRWALGGVLTGHVLLGFVWLVVFLAAVYFTSSETGAADLVLLLGGLCWLVALPIIVMAWQSGSPWYLGVPVAWAIVFAVASVVVVQESVSKTLSAESGPPPPGTACPKNAARSRSDQPRAASLIAFESDRDGNPEIYVMRADGSDQRRLTRNDTEDMEPAWSPDGRTIAFMRQCRYGSGRYDAQTEIFVMNADGSDQHNLTRQPMWSDQTPAWSPNGRRIAFVSNRGQGVNLEWSLVVMDADGTSQHVLTRNASRFAHPTWSPDGTQIAFVGRGDTTISVMNSDGSGQRRVTDPQADCEDPAWSPATNRIAFKQSFSNADDAIYTMKPDGSDQRRLTREDAGDPAWAPNGARIAFASGRDGNEYEIYVMNADGSGETRLTHDGATDARPSWWQPSSRRAAPPLPRRRTPRVQRPAPSVLFRDDFATHSPRWPQEHSDSATLEFKDGGYHIVENESNSGQSVEQDLARQTRGVQIGVSVRQVVARNGVGVGVTCRGDQTYMFTVYPVVQSYSVSSEPGGTIDEGTDAVIRKPPFANEIDASCSSSAVRHATKLTLRVNGKLLARLEDQHDAGYFSGFSIEAGAAGETPANLVFDDLLIRSL